MLDALVTLWHKALNVNAHTVIHTDAVTAIRRLSALKSHAEISAMSMPVPLKIVDTPG